MSQFNQPDNGWINRECKNGEQPRETFQNPPIISGGRRGLENNVSDWGTGFCFRSLQTEIPPSARQPSSLNGTNTFKLNPMEEKIRENGQTKIPKFRFNLSFKDPTQNQCRNESWAYTRSYWPSGGETAGVYRQFSQDSEENDRFTVLILRVPYHGRFLQSKNARARGPLLHSIGVPEKLELASLEDFSNFVQNLRPGSSFYGIRRTGRKVSSNYESNRGVLDKACVGMRVY